MTRLKNTLYLLKISFMIMMAGFLLGLVSRFVLGLFDLKLWSWLDLTLSTMDKWGFLGVFTCLAYALYTFLDTVAVSYEADVESEQEDDDELL